MNTIAAIHFHANYRLSPAWLRATPGTYAYFSDLQALGLAGLPGLGAWGVRDVARQRPRDRVVAEPRCELPLPWNTCRARLPSNPLSHRASSSISASSKIARHLPLRSLTWQNQTATDRASARFTAIIPPPWPSSSLAAHIVSSAFAVFTLKQADHLRSLLFPPERLRKCHCAMSKLRQLLCPCLQALGMVHLLFYSGYSLQPEA